MASTLAYMYVSETGTDKNERTRVKISRLQGETSTDQESIGWEQLVDQINELCPGYKQNFENNLYAQETDRRLSEAHGEDRVSWEDIKRKYAC